jgi:hypothetical protein
MPTFVQPVGQRSPVMFTERQNEEQSGVNVVLYPHGGVTDTGAVQLIAGYG